MKKLLSIILTILMVVTMIPFTPVAFAADTPAVTTTEPAPISDSGSATDSSDETTLWIAFNGSNQPITINLDDYACSIPFDSTVSDLIDIIADELQMEAERLRLISYDGTELEAGYLYEWFLSVDGDTYSISCRQEYFIDVILPENGKIMSFKSYAFAGDIVPMIVTSDEGYILDTMSVVASNDDSVEVTKVNNTTYTFTMPAADITFSATFTVCNHSHSEHTTATDNGDGTHSFICFACEKVITEEHTGGTATCTDKAVCETCGSEYGEVDADAHTDEDSNEFCDACGTLIDAKVLTSVGGYLYIDGVKAETNSSHTNQYLPTGNYILTGDIITSYKILVEEGESVTLDLNGYEWDLTSNPLWLSGTFSLYDTSENETGKLTSYCDFCSIYTWSSSRFSLYSGTIENTKPGSSTYALAAYSGYVNLYGGRIKTNAYAVYYIHYSNVTINLDSTVFECGEGYPQFTTDECYEVSASSVIDVTDYKGGKLAVEIDNTNITDKITIFTGIGSAQEAENYTVQDTSEDKYMNIFIEKTEYDEATGELSVYLGESAFTQQPTAENNYTIDFNNRDVSFSWHEIEESVFTPENVTAGNDVVFENGKWLCAVGEYSKMFTFNAQAGNVIEISSNSSEKFYVDITNADWTMEEVIAITGSGSFTVSEDAILTVWVNASNVSEDLELEFSLVRISDAPDGETGKTLQNPVCGKTYQCKATTSKGYECYSDRVTVAHIGGTATCTEKAVCETCGENYGEVDKNNHDETVEYENGFCEYGCYEPAVPNGDVYEISNAGQLYWFAAKVNAGETTINGKLMENIVVNEGTMTAETTDAREWTPIGNDSNQYTGTFEGNNKTVSGLYFNNDESEYVGLFGYVGIGGKVQNVGVVNSYISGFCYVGGVAGYLYESTATNCYNTGTVSGNYVGGVVGYIYDGTVNSCYNTGYVTSTISGIQYAGGVVGQNDAGYVTNCYYLDTCGATGEGTAKSTTQFASGEVAYLLGGDQTEDIWGQTIGTDTYPVLNGVKVYQVTNCKDETVYSNVSENGTHAWADGICTVCGTSSHTCDFSGELKYDDEKHWKECTADGCGKISEEAEHSFTDSNCACGYTCPHEKYTDGYCDNCEYPCFHSFTEFNETVAPKCEETGWEESICDYDCGIKLEQEIPALEHDWVSGGVERPTQNIDGSWSDGYYYDTCKNDVSHINITGVAKRADYTAYDEAYKALKAEQKNGSLTDAGAASVNQAVMTGMVMPQNIIEDESSAAYLNNWVKNAQSILAKIENGEYVKVDGFTVYNERGREWLLKFNDDGVYEKANEIMLNLTDEANAKMREIYDFALSLEGNVAENAENIAKVEADIDEFFGQIENCIYGTHNVRQYNEIEAAKCGVNAVEEGSCWLCGEVLTREAEDTALTHSFTTYEEVEAPKCGVAGKEAATCDNGCGETDEKEIPALEHIFLDYTSNGDATCTADGSKTAECVNGCGETDTVADEDSMLDHADEDGDNLCDDCEAEIIDTCPDCGRPVHEETGIPQYICLLIAFIKLVISLVQAVV